MTTMAAKTITMEAMSAVRSPLTRWAAVASPWRSRAQPYGQGLAPDHRPEVPAEGVQDLTVLGNLERAQESTARPAGPSPHSSQPR